MRIFCILAAVFCMVGCEATNSPAPVNADAEVDYPPSPVYKEVRWIRPVPPYELANFRGVKQRSPNWCWAACLEMVYQQRGLTAVRQEQFVNAQYGQIVDRPADDAGILGWLRGANVDIKDSSIISITCAYGQGKPDRRMIENHFKSQGWPFDSPCALIVSIEKRNAYHAVVVYGYHALSDGRFFVHVYDPIDGEQEWDLDEVYGWRATFTPTIMVVTPQGVKIELQKRLREGKLIEELKSSLHDDRLVEELERMLRDFAAEPAPAAR